MHAQNLLIQVERTRDLVRDSGQRKLTFSSQNHCTSTTSFLSADQIIKEEFIMSYLYKTRGTCSTMIEVELDGNIVKNVKFTGGCNGNLQAIPKLVQGLTVEQVEEKLSGISCSGRPTSCGDQLAKACRAALEAQNA